MSEIEIETVFFGDEGRYVSTMFQIFARDASKPYSPTLSDIESMKSFCQELAKRSRITPQRIIELERAAKKKFDELTQRMKNNEDRIEEIRREFNRRYDVKQLIQSVIQLVPIDSIRFSLESKSRDIFFQMDSFRYLEAPERDSIIMKDFGAVFQKEAQTQSSEKWHRNISQLLNICSLDLQRTNEGTSIHSMLNAH